MAQRVALRHVSHRLAAAGRVPSNLTHATMRSCSRGYSSLVPGSAIRTNNNSNTALSLMRRRMVSSTTTLWEDAKPAEATTADNAEAPSETESKGPSPFEQEVAAANAASTDPSDECPEWQNPRHHADPLKSKVFDDEFGPDEAVPDATPLPPFDQGDGRVLASPELHDIAEEIVNMSMVEVNQLVDRIAEHFGIEDDVGPPPAMDGAGGDGAAEEAAEEEEVKTAFDLKLMSFDAKAKIKVIKEVRGMAGLGLKEAKEMVEGAPKTIMKEIKKEEAEELKAKLEELGAVVEIV